MPAANATGWHLLVCVNQRYGFDSPSCGASGGQQLATALERLLAARGLALPVEAIHCFGYCTEGANVHRGRQRAPRPGRPLLPPRHH